MRDFFCIFKVKLHVRLTENVFLPFSIIRCAEQMQPHVLGSRVRPRQHLPSLMRGSLPMRLAKMQQG